MSYVKISLGDLSRIVENSDSEKVMSVADEMVAANKGGVPKFEPCDQTGNLLPVEEEPVPDTDPSPPMTGNFFQEESTTEMSDFGAVIHDAAGGARLQNLYDKLEAGGVSGLQREQTPLGFKPGDRMAAIGYSTQAQRKIEHDNKMPVSQAIAELQAAVINEGREDHSVSAKEFAANIKIVNGKLTAFGYQVSEFALEGLFRNRIKSPGLSYVLGLQDRYREEHGNFAFDQDIARNDVPWLAEVLAYECAHYGKVPLKLRTRKNPHDIFAIVSDIYSPMDAPAVIKQINGKIPSGVRGVWHYCPETTNWGLEMANWTPIPTLEQNIGEPASAFLSISGNDRGEGRLRGSGGIFVIQCLNASLYTADSSSASRVHKGKNALVDVATLIRSAMKSINVLAEAWGINRTTVIEPPAGISIEKAIPGFWKSLLAEKPLAAVLSGRKEDNIVKLTKVYQEERRDKNQLRRSDFAQAWTRMIQSYDNDIRMEAEQAIGSWLVNPTKMKCLLDD